MTPLYSSSDEQRVHPIPPRSDLPIEPYRTPYRRDYARLIHSAAFRRLQGKTQLFHVLESDFFRNRLTHSIEVSQIAESIAIRLNNTTPYFKKNPINTDLMRTAALAHDIGHPPFGHNGEKALNDCMRRAGGFEGNAQTLRILGRLEKRELKGDGDLAGVSCNGHDLRVGLNLIYRTLASVLKYDRRIPVISRPGQTNQGLLRFRRVASEKGKKICLKKRINTKTIQDPGMQYHGNFT